MKRPKPNATSFRRGRQKTGGRRRGTPNRNTQLLREVVLLAAAAAGSEKGKNGLFLYLKGVAKKKPAIFVPLLGKILPLQVESQQISKTEVTYRGAAEIREELIRRGVPVEFIFSEPTSVDVQAATSTEDNIEEKRQQNEEKKIEH